MCESEVLVLNEGSDNECKKCDGFADVFCIAWNGCWEQIFKAFLVIAAIVALLYLVVCKCIPCKLVSCCTEKLFANSCGTKAKRNKSQKADKKEDVKGEEANRV